MNEYEIFNSDEDDVLTESKPVKKEKKIEANNFWSNLFSFEMLPIALAITSLFFSLFTYLLPLLVYSHIIVAVFFTISFLIAFSSLVISVIPMVSKRKLTINLQIILSLFALIVSIPSIF